MKYPVSPEALHRRFIIRLGMLNSMRQHDDPDLKRLDHDVKSNIKQRHSDWGTSAQAQYRIDELTPISQERWSRNTQQLAEVFMTGMGALVFSTLPQILGAAASRGFLATFAGLLGGAGLVWFTHSSANKGIGHLRSRHSSKTALTILDQLHQKDNHPNEFTDAQFESRAALLWEVEGGTLSSSFSQDLLWAIIATIVETLAAFWLTLPAGWFIAILAAAFPAILIWISSIFQSYYVDFAKWAGQTVQTYSNYLDDGEVPDEEWLQIAALNAKFQFYINVNTACRTAQGAEANAVKQCAEKELYAWDEAHSLAAAQATEDYKKQEQILTQQYKTAKKLLEVQLLDSHVAVETAVAGQRPEAVLAAHHRTIRSKLENLKLDYEEELQTLNQNHDESLENLKYSYGKVINKWNALRLSALAEFDRWEAAKDNTAA